MLTVHEIDERRRWNDCLRSLPYAHVLQTWQWGEFKRISGWAPQRLAFQRKGQIVALASLASRKIGPFTVQVISKGPALDYSDSALAAAVLHELERRARRFGTIWLKIDPDIVAATGLPKSENDQPDTTGGAIIDLLQARGWHFSAEQVQFRNTLAIDLRRPEDEIWRALSGNTRRKVRLAAKREVRIRPAGLADLPLLYQLYRLTSERDNFFIRPFAYYERAWRDFIAAGLAQAFIAEYAGRALAHVILFHFGPKCWYFYGASADAERRRMPNYALQWAAIQWARDQGYTVYDMWGAPDVFDESDRMWGVYQFKRGFRGTLLRHIGAWDFAPQPLLRYVYNRLSARLRKIV